MLTLCQALVDRGHSLDVVAPHPGADAHAHTHKTPRWPGVTLRWTQRLPRSRLAYGAGILDNIEGAPLAGLESPLLVAAMAAEVLRHRSSWDALISHWLLPAGLLGEALRGDRPHVAVTHSADLWLLRRAGLAGAQLAHYVADGAAGLVAVSPHHAAELSALTGGLSRPWVVPMPPRPRQPIPPAVRQRMEHRIGRPKGESVRVALVARLVPVKGVDVALRAIARPEAHGHSLLIAGDGPERQRLEALAEKLSAPATFLGAIDPDEREVLLNESDLLVIPSRRLPGGRTEGSPVAALEALTAGLPVVASDVGGLRWLIGDGGKLVTPESPAALAYALAELREKPRRVETMGRAARRRAQRFDAPRAAAAVEALILRGVSACTRR